MLSIETFRGVDTNNAGDGDNNFGEDFFLEELRSTHVYGTPSVGVTKAVPRSKMLGHSSSNYLIKKVGYC